jgi:hypothetical protein
MELLHHWARMTHGQRRALLKAAREMTATRSQPTLT